MSISLVGASCPKGLSKETVGRGNTPKLAREGKLPAARVGREWRFVRENLIRWLAVGSDEAYLDEVFKRRGVK